MAKYSVILPVRNGGDYVKACISSILAQTFPDFELLILENNSTDGTADWLNQLSDPRIRLFPAASSLSITENWGRIIDLPKSEYMTMIGHDDVLAPHYLEEMDRLISEYPSAGLYVSHFQYIGSSGHIIRSCRPFKQKYSAADYLEGIFDGSLDINGTGYMVRSELYDRIGGIPLYPNLLFSDFVLWLECIRGSFLVVSSRSCFFYRLHQSMTTVSSDVSMQRAFIAMLGYFRQLKMDDSSVVSMIDKNMEAFILTHCVSLSHRMLRHKSEQRGGRTVQQWVDECQAEIDAFFPGQKISLRKSGMIKLSLFIDRFQITRKAFLIIRSIYKKPILH